jgi:peroxiredoxin
MNKQKQLMTLLFAFGVFLIGTAIILVLSNNADKIIQASAPVRQPVELNARAPDLSLTDIDGNNVSLDDYQGSVILVNNWAVWCPPCKAEMPELQEYFDRHQADGFILIAIDDGDPLADVTEFAQEYGLTFPIWIDPHGRALEIFQNWNLPSSYVIDRDGMLRYTWTGGIDLETLEAYVTPLLLP